MIKVIELTLQIAEFLDISLKVFIAQQYPAKVEDADTRTTLLFTRV